MLRCCTLGALELTDSTGREHTSVLSQPKRVALLVYLAVANPRGFHRRDSLLAMFWPELDQEHARAALRQALTFLRHELGEDVIRTRGAEEVDIDPERLWCDVVAFDDALRADDVEGALDLYQGHFLMGFHVSGCGEFEHWLEEQRRQLRDRAAGATSRLVDRAEEAGSLAEAARWGRRGVTLKPDDEQALRRLLVLLDQTGDRAGALRDYETFAERLATEYQADPTPETQALVSAIRTRQRRPRSSAVLEHRTGHIPRKVAANARSAFPLRTPRLVAFAPIVVLGVAAAAYAAIRLGGIDPLTALMTSRTTARRDLLVDCNRRF